MITVDAVRGHLLEEVLAWMLKTSGYRLLTCTADDPRELVQGRHGLCVRGRGAEHQADALGELTYVPPFSLPIRMFVEAKFQGRKVGLDVVRNAHGVIHDVNQNYATTYHRWRPRQRYNYLYSLFSTSGFSEEAQDFALTHQIQLVDLSTAAFLPLRRAVREAAEAILLEAKGAGFKTFPLTEVRRLIRILLETSGETEAGTHEPEAASAGDRKEWEERVRAHLKGLADFLTHKWRKRILLGFPAAPFVVAFATDDVDALLSGFHTTSVNSVKLRRGSSSGTGTTWTLRPTAEQAGIDYELTFVLPERIEDWITANPDEFAARRASIKSEYLSDMTLVVSSGNETRLLNLRYEPREFGYARGFPS